MNKEHKVLTLVFIGILTLFILSTFVSAQGFGETFEDLFSKWQEGQIGANVAKIIFFIMITILIALALTSVFSTWSKPFLIILSALVSFLAVAYITPAEVYSLLTSYTALGLTLVTLTPALVLGALTYKAATSGAPSLILLQKFAWMLFGVYLIWKVIEILISGEGSTILTIIVGVSMLAAVIMNLFNKKIVAWIMKSELEALVQAGQIKSEKATEAVKILSKSLERLAK